MHEDGTPDAELLARLAGPWGPAARAAMGELYARHSRGLRHFLVHLAGRDPRIEDWMQDTFLIAQRHAHSFRAGSARPWLLTLAARQVRDGRRAERRRRQREQVAATERRSLDPGAAAAPVSPIEVALSRLPQPVATLLELRFVQGLTHAEVAQVLAISIRTAKARAGEALDQLRATLEREQDR